MLQHDFEISESVHLQEFKKTPLVEKIVTRGANLLAPIL
jgi:hypothetical protein